MSKNRKSTIKKDTTFIYTSVCCNKPANKPPVQRKPEDLKENKWSECSLGKWHCSGCGKNCKVKRSKAKEESNGESDGAGTGN